MTDRFNSLTVVLKEDVREDDAESLIAAINHLRGVLSVNGNVRDICSHTAEIRAKNEMVKKLWAALDGKDS